MRPTRKRWTPEEDEYLATMFGTGLIDVMADRLGRTEKGIRLRANRLRIPGVRRGGRRLEPDLAALAALEDIPVNESDVLNRVRLASGVGLDALSKRSGYGLNCQHNLSNPTLRKAIDVAGALGFDLVLRRRA